MSAVRTEIIMNRHDRLSLILSVVCAVFITQVGYGQVETKSSADPNNAGSFAPLEQWKDAVIAGDTGGLKLMYSVTPSPRIITPAGETNADADISFWCGLKPRRMKLDVVQSTSPKPEVRQVVMQAEILSRTTSGDKTVYVTQAQLWQKQGEDWHLVAAKRTDPASLRQPAATTKNIYPAGVDAHSEIKEAGERAAKEHKRILLVFGANWCYDCHVLDLAFHRDDFAPVLAGGYEVVHVDVGKGDKNQDLMKQYEVPMDKGIPGLAVLESDGKLVYSQKNGEFENARSLTPEALLEFLNKWKPQAP
jgi:thioredoxin 1